MPNLILYMNIYVMGWSIYPTTFFVCMMTSWGDDRYAQPYSMYGRLRNGVMIDMPNPILYAPVSVNPQGATQGILTSYPGVYDNGVHTQGQFWHLN